MGNLIIIIAVVVIFALNILFGFIRGLAKSRIRGICILASAILAVSATLLFKNNLLSQDFIDAIVTWLRDQGYEMVRELFEISSTLNEVVLNCISSLIAPLITLIFFLAFMFVSWIVYLVLSLVLGGRLREHNERSKLRLTRSLIWGAIQGIVVILLLMLPISAYLDIAPKVMEAVIETDVMDESTEESIQPILDDVISPMNESGFIKAYRTLGGKGLTCLVTDFKINGERTHLNEEIDSVAAFACSIVRLSKTEFVAYSSEEAVVIVAIADSFEDSALLPAIAGEIIYGATDAWLNNEDFLGAKKPVPEGEMADVADDFLTSLLQILHTDARNPAALQSDIKTVAQIVASLANYEIFAKTENSDELLDALSKSAVIKELIISVGENGSMKILIPQITNMGIQAIAGTLEVPADKESVYHDLIEEIASSVDYVNRISADKARVRLLSTYLLDCFEDADIDISSQFVDAIAVAMDRDLLAASKAKELQASDVEAFFAIYSHVINNGNPSHAITSNPAFAAGVYGTMTNEQLFESGAVALAEAMKAIVDLTVGDGFDEAVTNELLKAFSVSADSTTDIAMVLKEIRLTAPLTSEMLNAFASLSSVDLFHTEYVTMEDLLVDPEAAVKKLNAQTLPNEAESINDVFQAIGDLLDYVNEPDFEFLDIAETVGVMLDSLKTGEIYGEEMTAKLFTAVLQSEMVREAANLTLETATEMAKKATEGDVSYAATFHSIAQSISVLMELGEKGNSASEEELVKLVQTINPQSAGMLEVYVNADRIEEYGVSSKYSGTSADLLSSTFGYMADNELEDEEAEAKALNQVLDIAISANSHSSDKQLFSNEEGEGVLPSATETVNTIMASKSVTHSLRENLLDEQGNVNEDKADAFDLGEKLEEDSAEYKEFMDALDASYAADPSTENKQTLSALAALFGIQY